MMDITSRLVASAGGGDSQKSLDEVLDSYSKMGFKKLEVYLKEHAKGRKSAFDIEKGPAYYLAKGQQYGMSFPSLHLSPVESDIDKSLARVLNEAAFAEAIGANVVIFEAVDKDTYINAAKSFLQAIKGRSIVPVIQVHEGGAVDSLQALMEVLDAVDDPALKVLHEVGSFHAIGVHWKEVCDIFKDRIALVHVKDMIGAQCVPFGTGEIDLPGLFNYLESMGYKGDYVIEIFPKDRENTNLYIAQAFEYVRNIFK